MSAATVDEPFSRARVSNAYLDAPRSLATWRRTAAAACVLAAIATGFALNADGPTPVRPASQVERYSLLDGVLERFDPAATTRGRGPVGAPLDIYEVGAKSVLYFVAVLRGAHTGVLPMYLIWFLAGLLLVLYAMTQVGF